MDYELDKHYLNVKKCFNRAFKTYDQYCELQNKIGSILIDKINSFSINPRYIIDLGCGTGNFTEKIVSS